VVALLAHLRSLGVCIRVLLGRRHEGVLAPFVRLTENERRDVVRDLRHVKVRGAAVRRSQVAAAAITGEPREQSAAHLDADESLLCRDCQRTVARWAELAALQTTKIGATSEMMEMADEDDDENSSAKPRVMNLSNVMLPPKQAKKSLKSAKNNIKSAS